MLHVLFSGCLYIAIEKFEITMSLSLNFTLGRHAFFGMQSSPLTELYIFAKKRKKEKIIPNCKPRFLPSDSHCQAQVRLQFTPLSTRDENNGICKQRLS